MCQKRSIATRRKTDLCERGPEVEEAVVENGDGPALATVLEDAGNEALVVARAELVQIRLRIA